MSERNRGTYILLLGIIATFMAGYLWDNIPDQCSADYVHEPMYHYSLFCSYIGSFCLITGFLTYAYDNIHLILKREKKPNLRNSAEIADKVKK